MSTPDHGSDAHSHDHPPVGGLRRAWRQVTHLVRPHSHDHVDSLDTVMVTSAQGIRATKVSLVVLSVTAVGQLVVFVVSGSIALLADTIHNVSDAFTSVPLWIAFALGRRAPTKRFTYGLGRLEDLAGIVIVLFIAASAVIAGWESVKALAQRTEYDNIGLVAAAGIIGFVGNEAVAVYRTRIGRRIGSAALIADGQHARTDGITSLGVVVSAAAAALGYPQADAMVGLVITAAILVILYSSTRDVLRRLLDAVDPDLVDTASATLVAVQGVESVDTVRMRWVGHRILAEADINVAADLDVGSAHDIAEQARHDLLHSVRGLDDVTIHVGPAGSQSPDDPHQMTAHHRPEQPG
ncbi:MAG: cation diffusion facilitator family transporter [Euzebya sp.]